MRILCLTLENLPIKIVILKKTYVFNLTITVKNIQIYH